MQARLTLLVGVLCFLSCDALMVDVSVAETQCLRQKFDAATKNVLAFGSNWDHPKFEEDRNALKKQCQGLNISLHKLPKWIAPASKMMKALLGTPDVALKVIEANYRIVDVAKNATRLAKLYEDYAANQTRPAGDASSFLEVGSEGGVPYIPAALVVSLFATLSWNDHLKDVCAIAVIGLLCACSLLVAIHLEHQSWFFMDLTGHELLSDRHWRSQVNSAMRSSIGFVTIGLCFVYAYFASMCYSTDNVSTCTFKKRRALFWLFPLLVVLLDGMMQSRASALLKEFTRVVTMYRARLTKRESDSSTSTQHMYRGLHMTKDPKLEESVAKRSSLDQYDDNAVDNPDEKAEHMAEAYFMNQANIFQSSRTLAYHTSTYFRYSGLAQTALFLLVIVMLHNLLVCY